MKNKTLMSAFIAILVTQLSGCGVLLHPEREGQRGEKIDPAIAILDAAGLVLFIVPGLIAFGVDFYYGTIYLPNSASVDLDEDELNMLKKLDQSERMDALAKIVSDKTGQQVAAKDLQSYQANSVDELNFYVNNSKAAPLQAG